MLDIAQPTVFSLSGQQMGREVRLTENALAVLKRRYLRRGPDGQPAETVEQVFQRVAFHVAAVEEEWGDDVAVVGGIFYDLITSLRFLPNSPTFTGAGTPLAQLAACFVLPISDDMGREEDGIFQTLRDAALIQQTGGGTGFSFSRLRPRGAVVRSSGGRATGPVGFMQVFDVASGIVSQGGARRGANMAVLRVDHPDIREFIHCKSNENAITNFNISVGVTDAFMRAVEEDGTVDMVGSQDGKVWKTVRAREIFDEIITGAHRNGEPGVLFLDAANRDNPCPHLGEYEASNPCGEQFLLPYENCCLGSVNLARHVSHGDNGHPAVDWENLRETVELAVRFLDDVINANAYVPAVPQLKEAAHRTRRIGLGIMGLGDLLYHLRVRYGSEEAQELAAQVMEFIRYHAMRTSIQLARKRGPFPAIRGSIYDPDDGSTELAEVLRWTVPRPLTPYARLEKWGRPPLDWEAVVEGIRRYGIHNAAQTTVAPTGTIATVSGCEAYGCEPVFALAYVRRVNDNGKDLELQYVSPLFLQALREAGLDDAARERIVQQVMVTGSCQNVEDVPPAVRDVFVVAGDITAEEHVRMQAALQAFVDSSISKTINFSATATPDDVARAFQLAWKLGCKGLTVYVTGSREKVVLETEATRRARKQARGTPMVLTTVRPRPHHLNGKTYRLGTPLGTAYITVNINGDGEPFEVFLNVGKAGSDTAAVAEAIGRLISFILRVPSPLSATRRLKQVVRQLKGIGGGRPLGFGRDRVQSLPDGVAQVLAEHLGMVESPGETEGIEQLSLFPAGDLCPECGHAALVNEEGCRRCYACGHSEC
ncbi:MAG: adenosylcobalamin-dependent ribonucleoside-diphosphate reductase [Chloroflexi bacterium]|nr:adenosylcobalamin-dependent ribonucleoside-diphosphate reductase [Chloroflexota bacterium]